LKIFQFTKQSRLRKPAEYRHVFSNAIKLKADGFLLYMRENPYSRPRLGLITQKKNIANAVDRNRIKRLVRESFRANQADLKACDFVVKSHKGVADQSNSEINRCLENLWKKAKAQ